MPLDAIRQKQLAQQCYWDDQEQDLWIDARELYPHYGAVAVPSWDKMMLSPESIPDYPTDWQVFHWARNPAMQSWRKLIPAWVLESCALFPSHQLKLLHFVARYPQLLELLDHSPMLAWRLIKSSLDEAGLVSLMTQKRTDLVEQVGWPGKAETVAFLRKLRLRLVNPQIAEQIDTCVLDEQRLTALQHLPRINSMALSLAARFPELIGCRLHHSLAAMPCRPMQCQSMIALLEDAYRLAEWLKLAPSEVDRIGNCRYLIEVEEIYQAWLNSMLTEGEMADLSLSDKWQKLETKAEWQAFSQLQQHAWMTDWKTDACLYASQQKDQLVGVLVSNQHKVLRVRQQENQLPTSEQLSQIHLWLTRLQLASPHGET